MQNTRYETEAYQTRLIQLGIPPAIMPANLNYVQVYRTFWQAMHCFEPSLIIKDTWQLICFSSPNLPVGEFIEKYNGDTDNWGNSFVHYASWAGRIDILMWFKEHDPDQLVAKDDYGRNLAHYAAWSGCTETLTWFRTYYPEQLLEKDTEGNSSGHWAARPGSTEALTWFKNYYPEQLIAKNKHGRNLAHYAAYSGCAEALTWFKDHYAKQLAETNKEGAKPVHYAAYSSCTETLTWFQDHCPEHLLATDNAGKDITFYASISDSTQQLETALVLSQHPYQFAFNRHVYPSFQEKCIITFLKVLETNYTITEVLNLSVVDEVRRDLINTFIARNKAIAANKLSFFPFMHQANHAYWPSDDIKMTILKHLLPPEVDVCRIYQSLLPRARLIFILQDKTRELISLAGNNNDATLKKDIIVLSKLINILQQMPEHAKKETILKQIEVWQEAQKTNPASSQFFKMKNPLQWVPLIKSILNDNEKEEDELTNQSTVNYV